MTAIATTPYLNIAPRTEEQALLDLEQRSRERDRYYTDDQRIAALESVLHYLKEADKWLVFFNGSVPLNEALKDELAGLHDLQSDVRGALRKLR